MLKSLPGDGDAASGNIYTCNHGAHCRCTKANSTDHTRAADCQNVGIAARPICGIRSREQIARPCLRKLHRENRLLRFRKGYRRPRRQAGRRWRQIVYDNSRAGRQAG